MTTTKKFTLKQYRRNEENNNHTENAVKLVHMYGTIEEINKIDQLAALEKAQDGLTMGQSRERYDISNKYYKQFLTDQQQQQPQEPTLGIDFPESRGTTEIEGRALLFENEITRRIGMPATCNACDRIIFADEQTPEQHTENGGYCPGCIEEMKGGQQ